MENIQSSYEKLFETAKTHGQEQIFQFWSKLDEKQKENLLTQVSELDFERLEGLVSENVIKAKPFPLPKTIEPAWFYPAKPAGEKQQNEYKRAWEVGENALRAGKVCAFTVAGGAGTRLGFDGPKGMFKTSPILSKSLFQMFAEYIMNCKKRYNPDLRWYLMTSTTNHQPTIQFFKENNFFGLNPGHIVFFQQGMMPAFDQEGKILLDTPWSLSLSPDGHGGSLRALRKSGALNEMEHLGIEYISYFQVDNPLVRCLDPLFIGLHIQCGSEMSSKSLAKAHDLEKVGNFVIGDDKMTVIEYSDLPDELATAKNADGSRKFDAGSIAIHILSRKFVERITEGDLKLPWHRANKAVPFVNKAAIKVRPKEPNAVKLEQFVFDAIPMAENSIILQTRREEEFSPVKNAEGSDSPATCKRDLSTRAARWLEATDVLIERDADGYAKAMVEISPLKAIFPDDLKK